MQKLWQDLRYAVRQLKKSPGFTAVAVITLALGIGASTAIFSVIDAVVLRPLPYNNVARIVDVKTHSASTYWQWCSWPGYLEMRKLNSSFQDLAGYVPWWGMTLRSGDQTQYLHVTQGTDNFFDVFGVPPLMGRTFLPGEDVPGKNNIVVLSYEVWKQTFHADRNVVGKIVDLDGGPYTVIGVMPAGFRFPLTEPNLVYIPMHVRPNWVGAWRDHWLQAVGRLKPGIPLQQAQADMAHVMAEIGEQQPDSDKGRTAHLVSISAALHGDNELPELWVLLGAVLAVLLVACVNVAGLLLARGTTREREMALRIAIGAPRGKLLRQLLVENTLLGIFGSLAGLLLAIGLLDALKTFLAHAFMRGGNVRINLEVVAAALAAGMFSSIAAGLIPAWRASRSSPGLALKSGVNSSGTRQQHRLRASFVVTQIALSLVLTVFAGLMLVTLQRMLHVDFGFNPNNLLILRINIPAGDYRGRDYVREFMTPMEERVRTIPGVKAAGFIDEPPVLGYGSESTMQLVGLPPDPPDRERNSETKNVTPGYYSTLGLPMPEGRSFTSQDAPNAQPVAIVNQAWVKEFLTPKQDPLTQMFRGKPNIAIVGVTHNVRQNVLEPARPEIDFPFSQLSLQSQQDAGSISVCLFVRTMIPPSSIVPQLRATLHDIAPAIAFQTPATMDDFLDDALVTNRMESWLFGIFAGIAVVLAAIGINGLLMQEVASRIREIGLRIALGSSRARIAGTVLGRIGGLLGIGLVAGLLLVFVLRRAIVSVLVIEGERDAVVITALVLLLALVGLLSALIPARRAAKVDPMVALRYE